MRSKGQRTHRPSAQPSLSQLTTDDSSGDESRDNDVERSMIAMLGRQLLQRRGDSVKKHSAPGNQRHCIAASIQQRANDAIE